MSNLNRRMLDLYSDYLISSFSYTTATGMSAMLNGSISHDQITRFLSADDYDSKNLWHLVKPTLRAVESDDGVLVFDDTVEEKPYTDENDIIAWHFDHTFGRSIKGVNIISCAYVNSIATIPLAFDIVRKPTEIIDPKTGRKKRIAEVTKNELFRSQLDRALRNNVRFAYVLADIWFSSVDNMEHILGKKKHFIFPLKSNRLVALSREDKLNGKFQAVESVKLEQGQVLRVFLKGLETEVLLLKQVFTNGDGSTGILYLVSSDLTLDYAAITTIYQKRWKVEEFHKSIKSNTALAKSPTKTVRSQSNHFFASIYGHFKLEMLKMKTQKNHFALKSQIYLQAVRQSFAALKELQAENMALRGA